MMVSCGTKKGIDKLQCSGNNFLLPLQKPADGRQVLGLFDLKGLSFQCFPGCSPTCNFSSKMRFA